MNAATQALSLRFWAKVDRTDTCWLWLATKGENGYGHFSIGATPRMAHRVAYELLVGPIPDGLQLDHLCRVRECVNPEHLEPVTPLENNRRSAPATRPTCAAGHLLSGYTVRLNAAGHRICRECKRGRQQDARAAHRLANPGPGTGSFQLSKTTCPQGHPYDEINTYTKRGGGRMCRECGRARCRRIRAERRTAALDVTS